MAAKPKKIKAFIKNIVRRLITPIINESRLEKDFTVSKINNEISELKKNNDFLMHCLARKIQNPETIGKKVSIIMPTYNRDFIIKDAIKSVLKQSYVNWELIIIDDGSTDFTSDAVEDYLLDPRIKYYRTLNNGVSRARNFGLMKSTGEYIAYLDSDNQYFKHYLLEMMHHLSTSHKRTAYCCMLVKNNNEEKLLFEKFEYEKLKQGNYIDLNCFMHARELYEELGGFDVSLSRLVDWDIILKYTKENYPIEVYSIGVDYFNGNWERISNSEDHDDNFNKIKKKL